jgi:2-polyprenyl-3-methyl-5-hydroxy-6-metoxy-1,4-benzoquinol methylase
LVFLANPPSEAGLYDEYYDGPEPPAGSYERKSADRRLRELYQINEQRLEYILRLKPAGSLLDIGCGRGYFVRSAVDAGFMATGIDVSDSALEHGRSILHVNVTARSVDDILRTGEKYDIITLFHVLEHFRDPLSVLRDVKALLATDGCCMIEVPNERSLKFRLSRNKWEGGNHPRYHRTFFTASSLDEMLHKAGFVKRTRLQVSYRLDGRSHAYELIKAGLNVFGMDSFLDYVAYPG